MGLLDFFKKKSSGDVAKDRLKLLLVSDRANCSPEIMEQIKNDIIAVISKYMDVDTEGLDIQITSTDLDGNSASVPAIFANIPIRDIRSSQGHPSVANQEPSGAEEGAARKPKNDQAAADNSAEKSANKNDNNNKNNNNNNNNQNNNSNKNGKNHSGYKGYQANKR